MKAIIIEVYGKGSALAELDERNPIIREAIWQALPIEGRAILWGEEVYFDLDMKLKDENPSASSEAGDICYCPQGLHYAYSSAKPSPIPGSTTSERWCRVWTYSKGSMQQTG